MTTPIPGPFVIPSAQEIFDLLMQKIEPELTSKEVSGLEEKYKNESPTEALQRAERYKQAFNTFDIAFEKYMMDLNDQVHRYRKSTFSSIEEEHREEEAEKMNSIETYFQTDTQ